MFSVAGYTGYPSTSQFYNKAIETVIDRTSSVQVPQSFAILLECSRFSNRVCKTASAILEENRGVSHHIVDMFEEEFDKVQRILLPGISGSSTLFPFHETSRFSDQFQIWITSLFCRHSWKCKHTTSCQCRISAQKSSNETF